jgi:hypothetical protein
MLGRVQWGNPCVRALLPPQYQTRLRRAILGMGSKNMYDKPARTFTRDWMLVGLLTVCTSVFWSFVNPELVALAQRSLEETTRSTEIDTRQICQTIPSASLFIRTELFFGALKLDGSEVTDTDFQKFINDEVTSRFPDGLTLLVGRGQFKNSRGVIVKENSRLLILLYPIAQRIDSSRKIEQIRKIYKNNFQQESVLRTDTQSCTSF